MASNKKANGNGENIVQRCKLRRQRMKAKKHIKGCNFARCKQILDCFLISAETAFGICTSSTHPLHFSTPQHKNSKPRASKWSQHGSKSHGKLSLHNLPWKLLRFVYVRPVFLDLMLQIERVREGKMFSHLQPINRCTLCKRIIHTLSSRKLLVGWVVCEWFRLRFSKLSQHMTHWTVLSEMCDELVTQKCQLVFWFTTFAKFKSQEVPLKLPSWFWLLSPLSKFIQSSPFTSMRESAISSNPLHPWLPVWPWKGKRFMHAHRPHNATAIYVKMRFHVTVYAASAIFALEFVIREL